MLVMVYKKIIIRVLEKKFNNKYYACLYHVYYIFYTTRIVFLISDIKHANSIIVKKKHF